MSGDESLRNRGLPGGAAAHCPVGPRTGIVNLHSPDCPCLGYGQVCSAHPDLAWGPGLPSWEGYPLYRVCWCGAGPRPCAPGERLAEVDRVALEVDRSALDYCREGLDQPPTSRRSDLADIFRWALVAAAITAVFGLVLNVLEAVL